MMKPKPPFRPKFFTVPTLIVVSSSSFEEDATEESSRRAARMVVHRKEAGPDDDAAADAETADADVVAWLKSEDPPLAVDERKRFMASTDSVNGREAQQRCKAKKW